MFNFAGPPEVTLNKVPLALTNTNVRFKATIKNMSNHQNVIWMKGTQPININDPKYEGSTESGDNPVLCIKNVREEDCDIYTIEVKNQLGSERGRQRLEVIEGKKKSFELLLEDFPGYFSKEFNFNFHC